LQVFHVTYAFVDVWNSVTGAIVIEFDMFKDQDCNHVKQMLKEG